MKFEKTEVWGFEHAVRGMRNALESWDKSDSYFDRLGKMIKNNVTQEVFDLGFNDLSLMQKLIHAGSEHRKGIRQIFVAVDITATLKWWKQFDTYKIGVTSNSCSTMHCIQKHKITMDCFQWEEQTTPIIQAERESLVNHLEKLRIEFLETKDKYYFNELTDMLPSNWLQKRTITMNYENILTMVHQRSHHKLDDWKINFINWAKSLPYAEELLFLKEKLNEQ